MAAQKSIRTGKGAQGATDGRRKVTIKTDEGESIALSSSRPLRELAGYLVCAKCGQPFTASGLVCYTRGGESVAISCEGCSREVWLSR